MSAPGASSPYPILEKLRRGRELGEEEVRAVVRGAADGSWSDAQLGAFLMAGAIRGLDETRTRALTEEMVASGAQWRISASVEGQVLDKHSTGGVGDKVSMLLAPLLAAAGMRFAKLTGRGLGHTGGTADKLECIPGLGLEMDRDRFVSCLEQTDIAIAVPTAQIAPADKRLYALRNLTATVDCLAFVVGSILAKKLALGAATLAFDVKVGNGAFFPDSERAEELARALVSICEDLDRSAIALVTDMSQPLGVWAGHRCEVTEVVECLQGGGDGRLLELVYSVAEALCDRAGAPVSRRRLQQLVASGHAWERFAKWAVAQGADARWLDSPHFDLSPVELVAEAERAGTLEWVDTRRLGHLLLAAGGGRQSATSALDAGVSLRYSGRIGGKVERGQELARLYVGKASEGLQEELDACFRVADRAEVPAVVHRRISGGKAGAQSGPPATPPM
jgi:pyrimidine-nucleoside phosphorylase